MVSVSSLQQFESDYQELWDWLMDMDAMVTDSHQLMMSEEQRHQLFKVGVLLLEGLFLLVLPPTWTTGDVCTEGQVVGQEG